MNKKVIMILFSILLMVVSVIADDSQEVISIAGITPDSPLYFIDTLIDDLSITNSNDRIKKRLEVLDERIAETSMMIAKNRSERIPKERINKLVSDIESEGSSTPEDQERSQEGIQKSIMVLERVLEASPEAAKETLSRVIEHHKVIAERIATKQSSEIKSPEEVIKESRDSIKNNTKESRTSLYSIYGATS